MVFCVTERLQRAGPLVDVGVPGCWDPWQTWESQGAGISPSFSLVASQLSQNLWFFWGVLAATSPFPCLLPWPGSLPLPHCPPPPTYIMYQPAIYKAITTCPPSICIDYLYLYLSINRLSSIYAISPLSSLSTIHHLSMSISPTNRIYQSFVHMSITISPLIVSAELTPRHELDLVESNWSNQALLCVYHLGCLCFSLQPSWWLLLAQKPSPGF